MTEPLTRLYLVTEPVGDAATALPSIEDALGGGDVACLLLRLRPAADRDLKETVRAIGPSVQARGVALLLEDARLAARAGADGVHGAGAGEVLDEALDAMKPERIVGAGLLVSRDDAMRAGEAGADYVMFGDAGFASAGPAPEAVLADVAWWAEIFNVPCVGFARSLDDVEALAAAGAEFVGLCDVVWSHPRGPAAAVREALAAVSRAGARAASAEREDQPA